MCNSEFWGGEDVDSEMLVDRRNTYIYRLAVLWKLVVLFSLCRGGGDDAHAEEGEHADAYAEKDFLFYGFHFYI